MNDATINVQAISAMSGPTAMIVNNQIQALHSAAVRFFNFSSASRCSFSNFSIVNVFNGRRTGLQNCQCESGKEVLIRPGWLWIKVSSLGRSEFPLFKSPGVDDESTLIISSIRSQSNPKHFEPLNLDYDKKNKNAGNITEIRPIYACDRVDCKRIDGDVVDVAVSLLTSRDHVMNLYLCETF